MMSVNVIHIVIPRYVYLFGYLFGYLFVKASQHIVEGLQDSVIL